MNCRKGDLEGLLAKFRARQVVAIPMPSISRYEPNEIMYCPRPATYGDGDQISKPEEFLVRAMGEIAKSIISKSGGALHCVSANHGLDITPEGISKKVAVEALNSTMPGHHHLVVYFGDSGNDLGVMQLKHDRGFGERTNSTVIPVAVCFKEEFTGGARLVPRTIIEISDAQVRRLGDIDQYESLVKAKIGELRSMHEAVRKLPPA